MSVKFVDFIIHIKIGTAYKTNLITALKKINKKRG